MQVLESKRLVLSRLGSNLIWNEEKVSIINTKWVGVLINGLREAKRKNPQFETKNIIDTSDSNEDFALVRPNLLPLLDTFRTLNWTTIKQEFEFSMFFNIFPNLLA